LSPATTVDRNWDNTWHGGGAFSHKDGGHGTSIGLSYESSPVDDKNWTFDLPIDEIFKDTFSCFWQGKKHLSSRSSAASISWPFVTAYATDKQDLAASSSLRIVNVDVRCSDIRHVCFRLRELTSI